MLSGVFPDSVERYIRELEVLQQKYLKWSESLQVKAQAWDVFVETMEKGFQVPKDVLESCSAIARALWGTT